MVSGERDSYIQRLFAERLGGADFGKGRDIYKFEKIKRAKRRALKENPGIELLDLGVGEPDEAAFPGVVETLQRECGRSENRGYADNGIEEFKDAAARYMERVFGVSGIDPQREVIHAIGSKSALAMFPAIFINKGDSALVTIPGYPVLCTHSKWYGGDVIYLPLKEENDFLPDLSLDSISEEERRRTKLLYINYPNNPTGATATVDFYKKVVKFAKENNIIVVQDAAYAGLTFNEKPLSFLSIPGAKDVGVEIHSLSKAFNMTGWRLAFVVGNELIINGFGYVKDNCDSGQFIAIQKAGIYALDHHEITEEIKVKYKRRLKLLAESLSSVGFNAKPPNGSFYLYVKIPRGIKGGRSFESAEDFSQYLIIEKLISTVPWDDVGHFVRFSATFEARDEEEERHIGREIRKRLGDVEFEF
ncbi:MAG: LL-diaminopimelate aminotransferase [Nitrospinae bacterium]|nr:LL-diaminopimelate aminotransferase [Nitrospinota bacterium]